MVRSLSNCTELERLFSEEWTTFGEWMNRKLEYASIVCLFSHLDIHVILMRVLRQLFVQAKFHRSSAVDWLSLACSLKSVECICTVSRFNCSLPWCYPFEYSFVKSVRCLFFYTLFLLGRDWCHWKAGSGWFLTDRTFILDFQFLPILKGGWTLGQSFVKDDYVKFGYCNTIWFCVTWFNP